MKLMVTYGMPSLRSKRGAAQQRDEADEARDG
jgi:hypothetical protein